MEKVRERKRTYKGIAIRMTNDLSIATLEAGRQKNIFKELRENNCQSRFSAKISFKNKQKSRHLQEKKTEFTTNRFSFLKILIYMYICIKKT